MQLTWRTFLKLKSKYIPLKICQLLVQWNKDQRVHEHVLERLSTGLVKKTKTNLSGLLHILLDTRQHKKTTHLWMTNSDYYMWLSLFLGLWQKTYLQPFLPRIGKEDKLGIWLMKKELKSAFLLCRLLGFDFWKGELMKTIAFPNGVYRIHKLSITFIK